LFHGAWVSNPGTLVEVCVAPHEPFPSQQLATEFERYPNLKTVVWRQEESRNQGAWGAIEPQVREILPSAAQLQYAGPPASASTAPGYHSAHAARQAALISSAFAM
jgi:2-oxoglutarate dehydrogenase E1 component